MPHTRPRRPRRRKRKSTGARAQGRQIESLNTRLATLTKQNFARVRTSWMRNNLTIDPIILAGSPYICPIPYSPCDPLGTGGTANTWIDNLGPVSVQQSSYAKRFVFGHPQSALNSNCVYHTGGLLKYQFISTEPTFSKIGLYLIRPRKDMADQLSIDRKLKSNNGADAFLTRDLDFTSHTGAGTLTVNQTYFGSEINKKYWDVLHHRELSFGHPSATGFANNVSANNANPANNAIVKSGTIRLPAGGFLKNSSVLPQTVQNPAASAFEMQFLDQANEKSVSLVLIHNGVAADNQTIYGGWIVNDYYKAVV